jgi:hypothetical protein
MIDGNRRSEGRPATRQGGARGFTEADETEIKQTQQTQQTQQTAEKGEI